MLVNDTNLPKVIIVLTSPRGKEKRDKRKECCCALFLPTKNIAALRQSDRQTDTTYLCIKGFFLM